MTEAPQVWTTLTARAERFAGLQDKNSKKIGMGLSLPMYLKDQIDTRRGDISRSRHITRMLEKEGNKKKLKVELGRQPHTQPSVVLVSTTGEPEN